MTAKWYNVMSRHINFLSRTRLEWLWTTCFEHLSRQAFFLLTRHWYVPHPTLPIQTKKTIHETSIWWHLVTNRIKAFFFIPTSPSSRPLGSQGCPSPWPLGSPPMPSVSLQWVPGDLGFPGVPSHGPLGSLLPCTLGLPWALGLPRGSRDPSERKLVFFSSLR